MSTAHAVKVSANVKPDCFLKLVPPSYHFPGIQALRAGLPENDCGDLLSKFISKT